VAKCREKGLGEILPGTIESVDFGNTRFDVITAFDVLEHVVDPISFIRRIFDLLNDDGLVVIAVPDVQCLSARISLKNWDQLILPMHLNYFCTKTLKRFLGDNGFNVLQISSQPSITIGLRRMLLKLKNTKNFAIINNAINWSFNVITLFKKHIFYPPINKLATKYQIESNLICVYAKKARGKE
jgi:hypothetical protein